MRDGTSECRQSDDPGEAGRPAPPDLLKGKAAETVDALPEYTVSASTHHGT